METIAGAPDGSIVGRSGTALWKANRDGSLVWRIQYSACPIEFPCLTAIDEQGHIYATSRGGLARLSPAGAEIWHNGEMTGAAVAIGASRVFGTSGFFGVTEQYVFAADRESGRTLWVIVLSAVEAIRYLVLDETRGNLYLFGSGRLRALDPETGSTRWNLTSSRCSLGAPGPIALDGTIYVPCALATPTLLMALRPDGTTKWERTISETPNVVRAPVIDRSGNVHAIVGRDVISLGPSGNYRWLYAGADGSEIGYTTPVVDAEDNVYVVDRASRTAATTIAAIRNGFRVREIVRADPSHGLSLLLLRDGRVAFNAQSQVYTFPSRGWDPALQWAMLGGDPGRTSSR